HRHVWVAIDADASAHAISNFFPVIIHAVERVKNRCHHGHRTQACIIQNFIMKLPALGSAINVECDRNHVRLLAELAHDSCVAVLYESAYWFGGIYDLECIQRG